MSILASHPWDAPELVFQQALRHLLAALILLFPPAVLAAPEGGGWELADAAVAAVDGEVITLSEVRSEREMLAWTEPAMPRDMVDEGIVRLMVRRRLLTAEAEKLRLAVTKEEMAAEVAYEVGAGGDPEEFRRILAAAGAGRADVERRAREVLFVRKYMDIRRQSTFVPESEVRDFYGEHIDVYGGKPLAAMRDEIRERLAGQKTRAQIDEWLARQYRTGRVRLMLPEGGLPGS